jgi:hypothetical protein
VTVRRHTILIAIQSQLSRDLVFFMPVLGVPIAVCGIGCGIIGLCMALTSRDYSLRWALG